MPEFEALKNPQTIGKHIRKRRKQLNLKQADIAKILNVSEDTITYWENDRSSPQTKFYPSIIQFLGYNPLIFETVTLGGRIKKYRVESGISQEKLANMVKVNESSILAWEANKRKPLTSKKKLLEKIISEKELSP